MTWEKGKTYTLDTQRLRKSVITYLGLNGEGSLDFEIDKQSRIGSDSKYPGVKISLELRKDYSFEHFNLGETKTLTPLELIAQGNERDHQVRVHVEY